MIKSINREDIVTILEQDHPAWSSQYLEDIAQKMIVSLDNHLEMPLYDYVYLRNPTDYEYGEFSILTIRSLLACSYMDAIMLMDEYIKDPFTGKANILRR